MCGADEACAVVQDEGPGGTAAPATVLISDAPVLAVDAPAALPTTVTLRLTTEQAVQLMTAVDRGDSVRVLLRPGEGGR